MTYTHLKVLSVWKIFDEHNKYQQKKENQVEIGPHIVLLFDTMQVSMETDARNMKLQVLPESMQSILQPLSDCVRPACLVEVGGQKWKRHPSLILYCCAISQGDDIPRWST